MFKKRIVLLLLAMSLLIMSSGCSMIESAIDEVTGGKSGSATGGGIGKSKNNEVYKDLSALIDNPEGTSSLFGEKISFVVYTISEPFEMEIEEENGKWVNQTFQGAMISRNNDVFLLAVDKISEDKRLPEFSFATVTGSPDGTVYSDEGNKRTHTLTIDVEKMSEFVPNFEDVDHSGTIDVENGKATIEIRDVKYVEDVFGKGAIALTFSFTNKSSENLKPKMSAYDYYQHGDSLKVASIASTVKVEGIVDPSALLAGSFDTVETYPGKTTLYYVLLQGDSTYSEDGDYIIDVTKTDPVEVVLYGDEYNFIYGIVVDPVKGLITDPDEIDKIMDEIEAGGTAEAVESSEEIAKI